jgi:hypothetical protein
MIHGGIDAPADALQTKALAFPNERKNQVLFFSLPDYVTTAAAIL